MGICCSKCEKSTDKDKLPPGWRRHADAVWCADCWSKAFVPRAVTVRVSQPMERNWDEFGAALRDSWSQAARLSNWTVRELALADPAAVTPEVRPEKIGKMPIPKDIYARGTAAFPSMPTGTLSAIQHATIKLYGKQRYEIWWRGKRSLPNQLWPAPWPVRAQDWGLKIGPEGRIFISCPLAGKARWTFMLGTSALRSPRAKAAMRGIANGEYLATELKLVRQNAAGNHKGGGTVSESSNGAAQKSRSRVMAKIVYWMPRRELSGRSGSMKVFTGSDFLMGAVVEGDERIWKQHARHLIGWQKNHAVALGRLSDDRKAETRMPRPRRIVWNEMVGKLCDKHRRRMDTGLHELARNIVNYAARRRVEIIEYDDSFRGLEGCESFPFFKVKELISQKCAEMNIEFVALSEPDDEGDEPESVESGGLSEKK